MKNIHVIDEVVADMKAIEEILTGQGLRSIAKFQRLVITYAQAQRDLWAQTEEEGSPHFGIVEALQNTVFQDKATDLCEPSPEPSSPLQPPSG